MKYLLRYFIFIGISYFIEKRIEEYFWEHASPELKKELDKKLKDLPELDGLSESTKDSIDTCSGANLVLYYGL
jgi:hypothetical protein